MAVVVYQPVGTGGNGTVHEFVSVGVIFDLPESKIRLLPNVIGCRQ